MATITSGVRTPMGGTLAVYPTVRVKPTAARSAAVANVGWRYMRRCTITNTGAAPIENYLYAIDLGVTTALVSGAKLQSDGDDLRVWHNGAEVQRAVVDVNQASFSTLVWIVIPYLGAGESGVWDVVYGNANAVAAGIPTFAIYDGLSAPDVATAGANRSTNLKHVYPVARTVANAAKGGWPLSTGTAQPDVDFSAPMAWQMTNTKTGSDDDRWQQAYSTYDASGTKYQGRFEARRAAQGGLVVTRDSGNDGVALRNPVGITSVVFDVRWQNDAVSPGSTDPVGRVVLLTRNSDDEDWKVQWSSSALAAADTIIGSQTQTPAAPVKEIAFAVWPAEGDNVSPTADPARFINAAWNSVLEVNIAPGVITQDLAAEVEIYELATELRSGGGGDAAGVPPYESVLLGNARQESGKGTPRLGVQLNQNVVVDSLEGSVEVWNSALTAKVETVPVPAVNALSGVRQSDGSATERPSQEWLAIRPVDNPLANPSADVDATGWVRGTVTALVTASAVARHVATFDSTPASFETVVSVNTAGVGGIVEDIESTYVPIGELESVWLWMALRTTNVNLQPTPSVWFYDGSLVLVSKAMQADFVIPAANTWYVRAFATAVPAGTLYYRVGQTAKSKTSNQTGTVRFDTVEPMGEGIVVLDVSSGVLDVSAEWTSAYGSA